MQKAPPDSVETEEEDVWLDPELEKAEDLLEEGAADPALEILTTYLKKEANSVDALYFLGLAQLMKGSYPEAMQNFQRAVSLDPTHSSALFNIASLKLQAGDLSCVTELSKYLEINPDDADALQNRGIVRNQQKDYEGALADFSAAIAAEESAAALNNRGNLYFAAFKKLDEAIVDFNRALELEPNSVITLKNRALVRMEKGDSKGAVEDLRAAAALSPQDSEVKELLAKYSKADPAPSGGKNQKKKQEKRKLQGQGQ